MTLSYQERRNVAAIFDHARDTFLERGLIPAGVLGLDRSEPGGLFVLSLLGNKADIRAMLNDYLNHLGTEDTTEESFVIPTGKDPE